MPTLSRSLCRLALLALCLAPSHAWAYIDPGTTQSLFAILAPVIALFGAFIGYVLWPFRYVLFRAFRKSKPEESAAQPEAPASQEPPKEE